VKIKFSDFAVSSVSKTGPTPPLKSFFGLLESGIQRNSNPIRLLGIGVRLHSVIKKNAQLDFIDVLDPVNPDHPDVHPKFHDALCWSFCSYLTCFCLLNHSF
jgi:hypothetical protein